MLTYRLIRSGPMALWMLAGWIVLSAMDAFLSLRLLDMGATEINPVARWMLSLGDGWFWGIKMTAAVLVAVVLEAAYLRRRILGFRIITGVYFFQAIVVLILLHTAWRLS